ncbi:MAG: hypothetical protein P1U37_03560 [Minwuia sp.]|nr:hypothetical protein [Minwuia sp.]MDF1734335.1 hypothetical protein [Minwuia sp.]
MQRSTPSKAEEKLALEERKARQMIKDKETARVARNAKVEKLKALRIAKEAEELKAKEAEAAAAPAPRKRKAAAKKKTAS